MNVKFYFLSLVAAVAAVSCVDSTYDLTEVNSDNIVIGDKNTVFTVPIATITITKDNFNKYISASSADDDLKVVTRASYTDMSFSDMLELVNAFLPSGEEVDIAKLTNDDTSADYTTELTGKLVDELKNDDTKKEQFAQTIVDYQDDLSFGAGDDDYNDIFTELNIETDNDGRYTVESVKDALTETLNDDTLIENLKTSVSNTVNDSVLEDLKDHVDTEIEQTIDSFDLPTDVIDMIVGDEGRVEIIATYEHDFPFKFDLEDLELTGTSETIKFPVTDAKNEAEDAAEVDLDKLSDILAQGAGITSGINLKSYTSTGTTGTAIKIKLVVKKYGGIAL